VAHTFQHARTFRQRIAKSAGLFQTPSMSRPLALVCYEKLLPGSQLLNRLQDLGYRVQAVTDAGTLAACAEQEKPLLVLADLESSRTRVCDAIIELRRNPATQHLPVVAFAREEAAGLQEAARAAGATLVVNEAGLLSQLRQLLDQALQVE
jgi:CheY-like chemotaxis protein